MQGIDGHPQFPRSIVSEVALKIPLIGVDTDIGALEEKYVLFLVLFAF
jgi:hypothetical protein